MFERHGIKILSVATPSTPSPFGELRDCLEAETERAGLKIVLLVLCLFNVRTNLKASRRFSEKLNQLQKEMKTAGGNTHFSN